MDILPSGNIFRELQVVHDTGYLSAQTSLEDHWEQVNYLDWTFCTLCILFAYCLLFSVSNMWGFLFSSRIYLRVYTVLLVCCVTRNELQLPHYNGSSCWSCGPSHAHVGAPYCLLWAGVFFKSDFSFFYKEGIPIWKKEKKTIFGGGKEMEETTKLVLMHPTNVTKTKQQKRKKKEEYRSSNDNCLIIPSYPIRSMRFLNVLYYLPKKKLD